jgi:Arc/MetJ family transcription regulator
MTKRWVDIDEAVLAAACAALGTPTIEATVDVVLKIAARSRNVDTADALETLSTHRIADRSDAWRWVS